MAVTDTRSENVNPFPASGDEETGRNAEPGDTWFQTMMTPRAWWEDRSNPRARRPNNSDDGIDGRLSLRILGVTRRTPAPQRRSSDGRARAWVFGAEKWKMEGEFGVSDPN